MWQKRAGHEHDHIDARTGVHHISLHNPHTEGEHLLHIHMGLDGCPTCGRPYPRDGVGQIDPAAIVREALELLESNHAAVMQYAAKHGIALKIGPNAKLLPGHQVHAKTAEHQIISAPKVSE